MSRRVKIMTIILSVVFGGIIAFNIAKKFIIYYLFKNYVPPAVSVSSVTAKSASWHPYISSVGSFVAINGTDISSQSPGQITKIYFKSGHYINEGAPLLDLDDAIEQADLKFNMSGLTLSRAEYNRQKELYTQNATSSSSLDKAQASMLEAEAQVEKIKAIIKQKHITAPFSGILGIRQVGVGQYVRPGETNIVSLQALDPIFLKFYVPEQLLNKIHLKQTINFSVDEYPNKIFLGKVTAINVKSDVNTHNIEVQASVNNCPSAELYFPNNSNLISIKQKKGSKKQIITCQAKENLANNVVRYAFVPGMFTDIKIIQPLTKNNVIVPSTAISYSMYGDSVFVISEDKTKSKHIYTVKKVFVKTGGEHGIYTIIKQGLTAGQLVVASGELKLQNGTQVIINNQAPITKTNNNGQ